MLAIPAMTLVLALTVAAFTGMVQAAVLTAETAGSWQATGADVVVAAPSQLQPEPCGRARDRRGAGGRACRPAYTVAESVMSGVEEVTDIFVNPASYAALVTSTMGFSTVRPALLAQTRDQGAIPMLASPQAAAYMRGRAGVTILAQQGLPTLRVRVAGELQSTPASGRAHFLSSPWPSLAAALALAVMLLQLALGAADRELTTTRLAAMGLTEGQRVRLVALEVVRCG